MIKKNYIFKLNFNLESHGLSRMRRNHIHFAIGRWGDADVKSGMRSNCNVFIYANVTKAMRGTFD